MSHHHQVDKQEENNSNNNNYPLDSNSYKLLNLIGRGVSAKVYKALCIPLNSSPVAIKSINLEKTRSDLESVRREAKTLTLLSHPNICKAHCSFTVKSQLWVVMPFMSCGSLQSIMSSSHPNGLAEPLISIVLKEVLNALSYLHGQGHLHRDIKAGNILVDSSGFVKLADFGVSASIYEWSSSSLMLTDIAGTPYWMAPEVIHSHTGYSYKADIWSFGITALELAHGRPPLSHLPPSKSLVMKITKRFRFSDHYEKGPDCKNKKKFSRAFKDMVGLCLDQDPSKRPSADKLLKHSFFKSCKGQDYLVRNLLQGLPSVENRFRLLRAGGDDEDDDVEGENVTKQRRISGWNFNVEGFELDPVFPLSEDSGVGGEDVKVKIDRDEKVGDDVGSSEEGSRHGPTSMQRAMARGCNEAADIEKRVVLEGLIALKKSLDEQRREVVRVIMSISNGGGEDLQNSEIIGKEDSYQMMMMQVNERLRLELENERKKRFGLEMELEFLKMQMSD